MPGDLRGRPPELVETDDGRLVGMREVVAHEPRRGSGQEHAPENGTKRLRDDVGTRCLGDRLCGDVGLLGGNPALLDRKRRDVAGGIDPAEALDAAVPIDRDEAVPGLGDAGDGLSDEARHRYDPVHGQRLTRREDELPVTEPERSSSRANLDPALLEELRRL